MYLKNLIIINSQVKKTGQTPGSRFLHWNQDWRKARIQHKSTLSVVTYNYRIPTYQNNQTTGSFRGTKNISKMFNHNINSQFWNLNRQKALTKNPQESKLSAVWQKETLSGFNLSIAQVKPDKVSLRTTLGSSWPCVVWQPEQSSSYQDRLGCHTAQVIPMFFNFTFDKGRLKNLVSWTLENYGQYKTLELLEQLKKTGFEYATKAGISLGIDDLKIPPKKKMLLLSAEKLTKYTVHQYQRADITAVERFQRLIDTWHRTSEQLKQEVISHFEETDILNPVYMMAFSGARGNISQVRQLVGMRGLMSDPQGQIIDFPIRSNFREGLTLTEYIISSYGARKGIVDTALRTANAGYLTRRLVDVAQHVMISHYDCGTSKGLFLTDMKEGNKTIVSVQSRIVGRVLARDIFKPNTTSKIASRNQEITTDLAFEITKITNKIFVRSSLTCNTTKLLCQLCYGWSLAQGNLVSVGEAVGVIAAQSIGEPGTQLTMRTFHTGGVFSGDISDEIRAPYNGFIHYANQIPGILIRTLDGKIRFLTKADGTLIFSLSAKSDFLTTLNLDIRKFKIPAYTILFMRNTEAVIQKQVVAQVTSIASKPNIRDTAEFVIKSEFEGVFYSKNLQVQKKMIGPKPKFGGEDKQKLLIDPKAMEVVVKARGWNFAWVLSGKRYEIPLLLKLFPIIGDYVNQQTIMTRQYLKVPAIYNVSLEKMISKIDIPQRKASLIQTITETRLNSKSAQSNLYKIKKLLLFKLFSKTHKINTGYLDLQQDKHITSNTRNKAQKIFKTKLHNMSYRTNTNNSKRSHKNSYNHKNLYNIKLSSQLGTVKSYINKISVKTNQINLFSQKQENIVNYLWSMENLSRINKIKIKHDFLFLNLQKIKYHKIGYFHFFNGERPAHNVQTLFLNFKKHRKFIYNFTNSEILLSPIALKAECTLKKSIILKRFKALKYLLEYISLNTSDITNKLNFLNSSINLLSVLPLNTSIQSVCPIIFNTFDVFNKRSEPSQAGVFLKKGFKTLLTKQTTSFTLTKKYRNEKTILLQTKLDFSKALFVKILQNNSISHKKLDRASRTRFSIEDQRNHKTIAFNKNINMPANVYKVVIANQKIKKYKKLYKTYLFGITNKTDSLLSNLKTLKKLKSFGNNRILIRSKNIKWDNVTGFNTRLLQTYQTSLQTLLFKNWLLENFNLSKETNINIKKNKAVFSNYIVLSRSSQKLQQINNQILKTLTKTKNVFLPKKTNFIIIRKNKKALHLLNITFKPTKYFLLNSNKAKNMELHYFPNLPPTVLLKKFNGDNKTQKLNVLFNKTKKTTVLEFIKKGTAQDNTKQLLKHFKKQKINCFKKQKVIQDKSFAIYDPQHRILHKKHDQRKMYLSLNTSKEIRFIINNTNFYSLLYYFKSVKNITTKAKINQKIIKYAIYNYQAKLDKIKLVKLNNIFKLAVVKSNRLKKIKKTLKNLVFKNQKFLLNKKQISYICMYFKNKRNNLLEEQNFDLNYFKKFNYIYMSYNSIALKSIKSKQLNKKTKNMLANTVHLKKTNITKEINTKQLISKKSFAPYGSLSYAQVKKSKTIVNLINPKTKKIKNNTLNIKEIVYIFFQNSTKINLTVKKENNISNARILDKGQDKKNASGWIYKTSNTLSKSIVKNKKLKFNNIFRTLTIYPGHSNIDKILFNNIAIKPIFNLSKKILAQISMPTIVLRNFEQICSTKNGQENYEILPDSGRTRFSYSLIPYNRNQSLDTSGLGNKIKSKYSQDRITLLNFSNRKNVLTSKKYPTNSSEDNQLKAKLNKETASSLRTKIALELKDLDRIFKTEIFKQKLVWIKNKKPRFLPKHLEKNTHTLETKTIVNTSAVNQVQKLCTMFLEKNQHTTTFTDQIIYENISNSINKIVGFNERLNKVDLGNKPKKVGTFFQNKEKSFIKTFAKPQHHKVEPFLNISPEVNQLKQSSSLYTAPVTKLNLIHNFNYLLYLYKLNPIKANFVTKSDNMLIINRKHVIEYFKKLKKKLQENRIKTKSQYILFTKLPEINLLQKVKEKTPFLKVLKNWNINQVYNYKEKNTFTRALFTYVKGNNKNSKYLNPKQKKELNLLPKNPNNNFIFKTLKINQKIQTNNILQNHRSNNSKKHTIKRLKKLSQVKTSKDFLNSKIKTSTGQKLPTKTSINKNIQKKHPVNTYKSDKVKDKTLLNNTIEKNFTKKMQIKQNIKSSNKLWFKNIISYTKLPFFDNQFKKPLYSFTYTAKNTTFINLYNVSCKLQPEHSSGCHTAENKFSLSLYTAQNQERRVVLQKSSNLKKLSLIPKQPCLNIAFYFKATKLLTYTNSNIAPYGSLSYAQVKQLQTNYQNKIKFLRRSNIYGEFNFNPKTFKPTSTIFFKKLEGLSKFLAQTNYYCPFQGELIHIKPYKKYLELNPYKNLKTGLFQSTSNTTKDAKMRMAMFTYYLKNINQHKNITQKGWSRFNLILTKKDLLALNYIQNNENLDNARILDFGQEAHNAAPYGSLSYAQVLITRPRTTQGSYFKSINVTVFSEIKMIAKNKEKSFSITPEFTYFSACLNSLFKNHFKNIFKIKTLSQFNKEYHFNKKYNLNFKNMWLDKTFQREQKLKLNAVTKNNYYSIKIRLSFKIKIKEKPKNDFLINKTKCSIQIPGEFYYQDNTSKAYLMNYKKQQISSKFYFFKVYNSLLNIKWLIFKQKILLTKNKIGFFFLKGNTFLNSSTKVIKMLFNNFIFLNKNIYNLDYLTILLEDSRSVDLMLSLELQKLHLNLSFLCIKPLHDKLTFLNETKPYFVTTKNANLQKIFTKTYLNYKNIKQFKFEPFNNYKKHKYYLKYNQTNIYKRTLDLTYKYFNFLKLININSLYYVQKQILLSNYLGNFNFNFNDLQASSSTTRPKTIEKQTKLISLKQEQELLRFIFSDLIILTLINTSNRLSSEIESFILISEFQTKKLNFLIKDNTSMRAVKKDAPKQTGANLVAVIKKSGQVIQMNKQKLTIRLGQPLVISPRSIIHATHGDFISDKTAVITLTYQQLKTGDIVQGIPKIEQLFEARTTKRGRLFRDNVSNLLTGLFLKYFIQSNYILRKNLVDLSKTTVENNTILNINTKLLKNKLYNQFLNNKQNQTMILALALQWSVKQSFYKIQQIIVDGILRVYRSQGVSIADKHVEIIVKQMTSKVRIINSNALKMNEYSFSLKNINRSLKTEINKPLILDSKEFNTGLNENFSTKETIGSGGYIETKLLEKLVSNNFDGPTGLFPGEIVDIDFVENINNFLLKTSSLDLLKTSSSNTFAIEPIKYEPIVLGITRASLEVDSFLSAASFQQTTKVLSQASLYKKKDFLKGLKENIIIGNLIPAGTGYLSSINL